MNSVSDLCITKQ